MKTGMQALQRMFGSLGRVSGLAPAPGRGFGPAFGPVFVLALVLLGSTDARAYTNFISNPYTLVPPGCVTAPTRQVLLYGDNVARVARATVELDSVDRDRFRSVDLEIFRVACAEPGRSAIWLVFTALDYDCTVYRAPAVGISSPNNWRGMRLAREPGTWGVGQGDRDLQVFGGETIGIGCQYMWPFLLDGDTPLASAYVGDQNEITAEEYNGAFQMKIWLNARDVYPETPASITFDIPSTESVLVRNARMPLNGRLSGNWIVEGASDQGFMISVSELVPDRIPLAGASGGVDLDQSRLLLFLSWYTFDTNGDLLWLTGAATFQIGESEVSVPIERVTDGQFLGSKVADREFVGSVRLIANHCNELSMEYELNAIGLGSGSEHLHRPHALETAGYVCRDLPARIGTRALR